MRVAILTISDRASAGVYEDGAGPAVGEIVTAAGGTIALTDLVPDDRAQIGSRLTAWCARGDLDLVLTTGGTGLGPRDVTPEATRAVIEREAPGLAEAMRAAGMTITPNAALSRQVCGTLGTTLIVNLPGSPKAARESLEAIIAILPHAVEMMQP